MKRIAVAVVLSMLVGALAWIGLLAWVIWEFAGSGCNGTLAKVQTGVAYVQRTQNELERVADLFAVYPGLDSILVEENCMRLERLGLPVPIPVASFAPIDGDMLVPPTGLIRFALNQELNRVTQFLCGQLISRASGDGENLTLFWGGTGLSIGGSYIWLERCAGGATPSGTQVFGFALQDWCQGVQKWDRRWTHVVGNWYVVAEWF